MKISLLQLDTQWQDVNANLDKIKQLIDPIEHTDLVVLPEMFNTAYIMHPKHGAEPIDGPTVQALIKIAKEKKTTIAGSIPTISDGKYYNTFLFVNADGIIHHYHKQHLFSPAGEAINYTPGLDSIDFSFNGTMIKSLVCYDLRFPYISYNDESVPFDLLIYSANWPMARIAQWEKLLMARAIENQSFVVGVNRVGSDENGFVYSGNSLVVDYLGDIILKMDDKEGVNTIEFDLEAMNQYRQKLPFLRDRRN
jgi:omega-amidase